MKDKQIAMATTIRVENGIRVATTPCRFRTTLSNELYRKFSDRKKINKLKSPNSPPRKKKREKDEQQLVVVVAQGEVDGVRHVTTREFHKQLEKSTIYY